MGSLDFILTVGALVIGVMMLTGHGDVFMSGGNKDARRKLYDEAKMEKASGIALIVIGIATGIDHFTTTAVAKFAYVGVIVVIMAILVVYIKKKCKK